jgi:hypothetical protein
MRKLNPLVVACFGLALVLTGCAQGSGSPPAPTGGGTNNNIPELSGIYAFAFDGITGGPGYSVVFAAVGRFTADGAGNLTNGEVDTGDSAKSGVSGHCKSPLGALA